MALDGQNPPLPLETSYLVLRAIKSFSMGVIWIGVNTVGCHDQGSPSDKNFLECLWLMISMLSLTLKPSPCL